jgi:nitrogenase molybdenum-iron protein NifN
MASGPVSTTNACKLCTPLGAAMAFKGVQGAVPFLHGSQGCATYMRRYIISHFREPVDIASSALGEKHAIYGGGPNLKQGILNVLHKYGASCIGIASTCLTETIGDDVPMLLAEFRQEFGDLDLPPLVHVSTPSYSGTHMEGFHGAVRALCEQLPQDDPQPHRRVTVLSGMVSPADIRHLKELLHAFGLQGTILPDYSETLDGPALHDYEKIPSGGTPLDALRALGGAPACIELGRTLLERPATAGTSLSSRFGTPLHRLGLPLGLRASDALFETLESLAGRYTPREHALERGRLLDAMVDGHKYIAAKRCVVYGEEDLVIGLTAFLAEIGVHPVLVATGGSAPGLADAVRQACDGLLPEMPEVRAGVDFFDIAQRAQELSPDLLLGHSKGFRMARQWDVPLVRAGFPIHDRFGAQRVQHLGYRGAQQLYDRIVNAVLAKKQADSDVGYGYL